MPAFGFNKHKRFTLRREVQLQAGRSTLQDGLMIELSCDGCRISGVPARGFAADRDVTVEIADRRLAGRVHCRNGTCLVVKFASALRLGELEDLLCLSREGQGASATA